MGCSSCGQGGGYSSPSSGGMSSGGGCGDRKAMDANTPLKKIQNGDSDFCFNEIDNNACENLANDKGIHPTKENTNDTCEDLKALNDLGIANLNNRLSMLDICNIEDLKCWLFSLLSWIWNINRAIICAICGLFAMIKELRQSFWEINTRYDIEYATDGMSVSIDRETGNFKFKFSDWKNYKKPDQTRIGRGTLTGTVNFGMRDNGNGFDWQIRDVYIDKFQYVTDNQGKIGMFQVNVYAKKKGEETVYVKRHDCTKSFTDNINKTVKIGKTGKVGKGQDSGWIQFLELFNDNLETAYDDDANLQIQFKNNLKGTPPKYV